MSKGLGRLAIPDLRDRHYPARTLFPSALETDDAVKALERGWRYWWAEGWWGDQGQTPQCVAYAVMHALEDGPVTWPDRAPGAGPIMSLDLLYKRAQDYDEWPGNDYAGTSARGALKFLQRQGVIGEYRWLFSVDEVAKALLTVGPVLLGSYWSTGMDKVDDKGFIHFTGSLRGGHETKLDGVNVKEEKVRLKNSWGRGWGDDGHAWVSFSDLELLLQFHGDAVVIVEEKTS